jgi:LysR family transcriptional regulator, benzoate and cis,cis-muconate-responsive activator of ben and cat genes
MHDRAGEENCVEGAACYLSGNNPMELRHLRYFVAVAEELNFTRAAARLHVSLPPLSRQIRDLERELGLELLVRNTRSVRLTEAGRMFQQEAAAILQRTNEAVESMRALTQSRRGRVRVGYAASPTIEILPRALRRFHKMKPSVRVELHDMSTQGMLRGLQERTLDVALIVSLARPELAGLVVEQIATYPGRVAMHSKHRFARLERVRLQDIAGESLVTFSRDEYPEAHQGIAKILAPYTRSPKVVAEYDTSVSLIAAVEAGRGIALLFETAGRLAAGRLVLRPIEPEPPPLPISVAYSSVMASSATLSFVEAAKEAAPKGSTKRRAALVVP